MIRWATRLVLGALLLFLVHLLVFRYFPVPVTPLMVLRALQGEGLDRQWVSLDEMSVHLPRAVIASEDNRFCEHGGVDWSEFKTVMEEYRDDGRLRGASTVSMQTVKNLYFWPGRSVIRKGLELAMVHVLEAAWSKDRIMEVYLNIAEMGPGIYGVEAAARRYWGVSALAVSANQSAALVSILPAPRKRNPTRVNRITADRIVRIKRSVVQLGPMLECVSVPKSRRSLRKQGDDLGIPVDVDTSQTVPVHFQLKDTKGKNKSAPNEPRRTKGKKVQPKRRRGAR